MMRSMHAGTPHRPAVVTDKQVCLFEAVAYADYLLSTARVPADRLLKETASYDTLGNAYFSAVIHAWPLRWRKIGVVTSAFHMPRTRAAFTRVFAFLDKQAGTECASGRA